VSGFNDLLEFASRASRLIDNECAVTEGRTISHVYSLVDNAGAAISLASGYTFDCKIVTDVDGSTVATMTVAGTSTGFTVAATPATMASTAGTSATANAPRRCLWYCSITRTSDSAKLQVWGPSNSPFTIAPE
jgi:hypothetical protein